MVGVKIYGFKIYILECTESLKFFYDTSAVCSRGCSPLSESASAVGAGFSVPATQAGCMPMAEVFKLAVSSFKVNDWNLFGSAV